MFSSAAATVNSNWLMGDIPDFISKNWISRFKGINGRGIKSLRPYHKFAMRPPQQLQVVKSSNVSQILKRRWPTCLCCSFQLIGIACLRAAMSHNQVKMPVKERSKKDLDPARFVYISDRTYTAAEVSVKSCLVCCYNCLESAWAHFPIAAYNTLLQLNLNLRTSHAIHGRLSSLSACNTQCLIFWVACQATINLILLAVATAYWSL